MLAKKRPSFPSWLALLLFLPIPQLAIARKCTDHVDETMTLLLSGVFQGDKAVPRPPALQDLDEMMNSTDQGNGILLHQRQSSDFAKFYTLRKRIPPTPEASLYILSLSSKRLRTACATTIPYTPILPGEYAFDQEYRDGAKKSRDIDDPVLVISADRQRATLQFSLGQARYRAEYQITGARFR